ncbi:unnamed protein product, partial [Effrenium voratum]
HAVVLKMWLGKVRQSIVRVLKGLEAALRLRAGLKAAAGNVFRALALQNASEHPKAWPTLLALQSLE